ncbi:MAG: SH3 domain-containing protein [Polyangiaceae bacterium]|nr:SH3 domain-containing protein [Polyangiaceae bacterium]
MPDAAPTQPVAQGARPRGARWIDRVTGLLLLAAGASVALAAAPAALRALGVGAPPRQSAARLPEIRYRAPASSPRFTFDLEDDEEPEDRLDPHAGAPHGGGGGDAPAHGDTGKIRMGLARRDLAVLGEPDAAGVRLGEIKAGDVIMVVREAGEWTLVIQNGADGVTMGWVRSSEIAIR